MTSEPLESLRGKAPSSPKVSFQDALLLVWRQTLVDNAKSVELGAECFPVRHTPRGLVQVDFVLHPEDIRGLEQNPRTNSRWAEMARAGKKVMQFLSQGRYIANVADGKLTLYGGSKVHQDEQS